MLVKPLKTHLTVGLDKIKKAYMGFLFLAEGTGFEPAEPVTVRSLSKRVP